MHSSQQAMLQTSVSIRDMGAMLSPTLSQSLTSSESCHALSSESEMYMCLLQLSDGSASICGQALIPAWQEKMGRGRLDKAGLLCEQLACYRQLLAVCRFLMLSGMTSLLKLSMLRSWQPGKYLGQAEHTAISGVASFEALDQIWRCSPSSKASQADTCCKARRVHCSLWFTNQTASNATAARILVEALSPFCGRYHSWETHLVDVRSWLTYN